MAVVAGWFKDDNSSRRGVREAGKEKGHTRPKAGSVLRLYPSGYFFTVPRSESPEAGLCATHSGISAGQPSCPRTNSCHLLPQSPPQRDHALTHSSATAPVPTSKTRSQMLKQHPTGLLYPSKPPGKVHDKGLQVSTHSPE